MAVPVGAAIEVMRDHNATHGVTCSRHRANFEDATGYRVTENQKEAEEATWEVMDEEEDTGGRSGGTKAAIAGSENATAINASEPARF
jgi:hypothetical protein